MRCPTVGGASIVLWITLIQDIDMPLPPLLAFGLQTGASIGSHFLQRGQQRRQFRHARRESQRAYAHDLNMWNRQSEWNREMWELQNQYNLPSRAMQRLRDAGLNPNLAAANASAGGQATAIQQATMPKYSPARPDYRMTPFEIPNMIGMYNSFKHQQAQIDLVKAQVDLTNERRMTEMKMRLPRWERENINREIDYNTAAYANAMSQAELDRRKQLVENMKLDAVRKRAEGPLKQEELKWMRDFGMRPGDALHYR